MISYLCSNTIFFFFDLRCILLSLSLIANLSLHCQYNINGNADSISQNCFRLTEALNGKWGSVWSTNKVNIKESFEVSMSLNFGNKDSGADGIAFVLQKILTQQDHQVLELATRVLVLPLLLNLIPIKMDLTQMKIIVQSKLMEK